MGFTKKDEKKLQEWFENKDNSLKDRKDLREAIDDYYKYRDLIYNIVTQKLNDLFQIKKGEWKAQFNIDEDDSTSIINDAVLASVNHYNVSNTKAKFITYLWKSLNSHIRNYVRKYLTNKLTKNGKVRNRIPFTHFLPISKYSNRLKLEEESRSKDWNDVIINYLQDNTDYVDSQKSYNFFMSDVFENLSKDQKYIMSLVMNGHNFREISEKVNLTRMGVVSKLECVGRKLQKAKNSKWRIKKQS